MSNADAKIRKLIYDVLNTTETEYKLKSIPKNILYSIHSLTIASKDIDILTDDIEDDPSFIEFLHYSNSFLRKQKIRLIHLWEITDNLSKANLCNDRKLLSEILPRIQKIQEKV